MNLQAVRAIYKFEMARTFRTPAQSVISPVVATSLYFVVFGAAIGSRIPEVGGVSYGSFIVPGLIILSILKVLMGLRVSEEEELMGLDLSQHNEKGYAL